MACIMMVWVGVACLAGDGGGNSLASPPAAHQQARNLVDKAIRSYENVLAAEPEQEKATIPDPVTQRKVEDAIRKEVFHGKRPSAGDLLKLALETKDKDGRYVAALMAMRSYTEACDHDKAFSAVNYLLQFYVGMNALQMKKDVLIAIVRKGLPPQKRKAAEASIALACEAALEDDYRFGIDLLKEIRSSLGPAPPWKVLAGRLSTRIEEAKEVQGVLEKDKISEVRARISRDPDDAEANLLLGKFHCLARREWKRGAAYLIKGSDPILQDLAKKETSASKGLTTEDRLDLAKAWEACARKEHGLYRRRMQAHALILYQKALGYLDPIKDLELRKYTQKCIDRLRSDVKPVDEPFVFSQSDINEDAVLLLTFDSKSWDSVGGKIVIRDQGRLKNDASVKSDSVKPGDGRAGQAVAFDGEGILSGQGKDFPLPAKEWSLSLWIMVNDSKQGTDMRNIFTFKRFHQLLLDPDGRLQSGNCCNEGDVFLWTTTHITDGKWHHVVSVMECAETSTLRIYMDGVEEVSMPAKNVAQPHPDVEWRLGGFKGFVDELAFFKRALSSAEIESLFDRGAAGLGIRD